MAELVGRDLLAELGEAHEVGEGHADVARARELPGLPLGGRHGLGAQDVAQVQLQHALEHGRGHRDELLHDGPVALGQLQLVGARLQRDLEHDGAHDLGRLGQAATEHAGRLQHLLLGEPLGAEAPRVACSVGVAAIHRFGDAL